VKSNLKKAYKKKGAMAEMGNMKKWCGRKGKGYRKWIAVYIQHTVYIKLAYVFAIFLQYKITF
jgi:hypothetical protein